MSNIFFRFKQFTVWHDRCAMKVGTDGVLLGAWCHPSPLTCSEASCSSYAASSKLSILDVGTGSGLIALMLAQRFPEAQIDAIDIAPESIDQARYNFELSPWSDRLQAHLSSLQTYAPLTEGGRGVSLIVSNPPYFIDSLKNPDHGRELARHTDTLSYADLLCHSARLMSKDGTLALILPAAAEADIIALAANHGLYPTRLTRVFSKPDKPTPIRILIEFSPLNCSEASCSSFAASSKLPLLSELYLESPTSPRSKEYSELTRDFYL